MTFSATYDGDGLRASKTAGGTTTYYLYDGEMPLLEENASGTVTAGNGEAADGWRARYYPGSLMIGSTDYGISSCEVLCQRKLIRRKTYSRPFFQC